MHQYQVLVETDGHRIFETNWVTGKETADPLVMLISSKFPEPVYHVSVAHRVMDLTAQPWSEFVVGEAVV